jgi:hypothetical protein
MADRDKPIDDDLRHDEMEYDPAVEPQSSKAWLNLLTESEDAFQDWNDHCDNIDRQYANMERLASIGRSKEFQMFWSNAEVLKPAIFPAPRRRSWCRGSRTGARSTRLRARCWSAARSWPST